MQFGVIKYSQYVLHETLRLGLSCFGPECVLHPTHNEAQHMLGGTHQLNSYFALNLCFPTHLPRIVLILRSEISTWMAHQRGHEGRGRLLVALVTPERTRCQSPMRGVLPQSPPRPPSPGTLLQTGKLPFYEPLMSLSLTAAVLPS